MSEMKEYLEDSNRTNPSVIPGLPTVPGHDSNPFYMVSAKQMELLHSAMGMTTESGEFMDQIKRHMIYGAELDETNLKEELGDMLWYIALAMRSLNTDFETEALRNIAKLKKRFPDKFTSENAITRDLDVERDTLEQNYVAG